MKKNLFLLLTCSWYSLNMSADNLPMKNDVIWFDKPIPSSVPPVWEYFDNLIVAGAKAQKNKDIYWENLSLPIGNGNIGANIMGSVETERITFNEKTLWRGGPNNKKGADYYWNVNKESVYLLSDIRKNLSDGNNKKAQELLSNNFNGKVSYEANGEDAFRFGSFTTAGEFRIKTGIGDNNVTDYVRSLSLDSALAKVSFVYNGVRYERSSFISHPDNIMVLKFSATDKQTLEFSYLPNPLMEGKFKKSGKDESMKRKEKAAVDEFVALVGGKTWEPVRHKCMGKWSGMTDYGFVIDGRITLFVSNSMAYFKKRIREWIKSIHTFEAKKDCYLRLLREQIEKDNDKAKDEKLNPVRLIDIGILSPESNSPFDFFTPYVLVEINGRRFKHQTAELSCAIMVDSLAGYLEECNCKDIYTARAVRTPDYIFCGVRFDSRDNMYKIGK